MLIDSPIVTGSLVVDGELHLPSGTTAQRPSGPLTGSLRFNTDSGSLELYNGIQWSAVQGGAASPAGPASADIEYLLVAGGGGGADVIGGGGGAGGFLSSSLASITSGSSITVTVGAGGTGGADSYGTNGVDSSIASAGGTAFNTVTPLGGGHGGVSTTVGDGGSGGGGSGLDGTFAGGSGTTGQGFAGGTGAGTSGLSDNRGGGGGGASEAGTGGKNITGDGGDGKQSPITGTATYYAGGGGGSKHPSAGSYGAGGLGGGGNGDVAGTANTGGGGGGSLTDGRAGGSGVAILAYPTGSVNGAGGIVGTTSSGKKYHQFNSSGTLSIGAANDFSIVTTSLISHYDAGNFESRGVPTWTDLQQNYNITVNGPTLTNQYYYDLDGTNDYFTTTLSSIATNFTGETWQKFDSVSRAVTAEYVMQFGSLGVGTGLVVARFGSSYNGGTENNKMYIHRGSDFVTSTNLLNDTNWHHFVLVANGTNAILYVDTVEWLNISINSTTTNNVFEMGRHTDGNSLYADSKIGMARVYTKALTAAEVLQNYNATKHNFV